MLECVVNVSEGADSSVLHALREAVRNDLLDVHSDAHHNRSVFTLVGEKAPRALTRVAVGLLSIATHDGVHPRLGVVDVVPFVPLSGSSMDDALAARQRFAQWAADELGLPSFLYGPERSLPTIRKNAWTPLFPDVGTREPHSTGAQCVSVPANHSLPTTCGYRVFRSMRPNTLHHVSALNTSERWVYKWVTSLR